MGTIGSFGTFTTARLAIYVSQKGLSVTGNNIANINTNGYTRQRLDQVSFKTGMADRYQNAFDKHVGNGAIAQNVSQLRDPYLDIRYRAEHSSEGFYNGKLNGLDQIADILDEIGTGENDGDGLLYGQFSDFFDALLHIEVGAGSQVNDTLAATSAEKLCQLFYNAANQLERLRSNTEVQLRQEIDSINSKLVSIRGLNETIQQAEIYGDPALELRDQRNVLIDELSEKLKIEATYSMVNIGGKEVEKLTIRLGDSNPDTDVFSDSSILVDGDFCAQLTTPLANDKGDDKYDSDYEIFDRDSTKYAQAVLDLKAGKEVDGPEGVKFADVDQLEEAINTFFQDHPESMKPYAYLDPNGVGTNDPRVAKQVFDENYNITVSDLRDANNKPWETKPIIQDTIVKNDQDFAQRASFNGVFQYSGTWKDGDKINININGTPPTQITLEVGEGKDITADDANGNAKNVSNAIRKKMLDSGKFVGYDIKTITTKTNGTCNVNLIVKAKDAGLKAETEIPKFTITAANTRQNTGSAGIGKVEPSPGQDGQPIPGQYTAEVTVSGMISGDKITVGAPPNAITLEVGKDIGEKSANDPAKLAARLAAKLGQSEQFKDYTVSSMEKEGKAYLVFQGPKDATTAPTRPNVTVTEATPVTFNLDATDVNDATNIGDPNKWYKGKDPTDVGKELMNTPPKTVDNGDNTTSRVITRYYIDDNDKWHKFVRTTSTSNTRLLDDNDMFGKLQAVRELLTEEGEFASQNDINTDESASIKRGIPFYQETLDLLARQFATVMNEANNGFAMDQNGNYLTSADGKTFEKLLDANGDPINKTNLTDAQKTTMETDALGNYIKANWAGMVKDADGKDTNVLADKYGNPLKLGGTELTKDMLKVDGNTWDTSVIADAAGIDEQGRFVDADGKVIGRPDPNDPTITIPATVTKMEFTDDAFGTVPTAADPANPTPEEAEAIKKAQEEIDAKKTAATAELKKEALDSYLAVNGGYKMGGNLFSNRGDTDDDTNITAKNISVSTSWSHDDVHVVPTYIKLFEGETSNTTQQDNALHMSNLLNRDLIYNPQDLMGDAVSTQLFEGSFQELLEHMGVTLGNDQNLTKLALETHSGQALEIDTSRDSVSAVDLNDEAMNLMSYTHSLNAAYRLMTTIDEMIDRLITGTGVTR